MQKRAFFASLLGLWVVSADAADVSPLSVSERYSYTMGVRLGQMLKEQGIERLDSQAFATAIDDVMSGRALRLSDAEMRDAVVAQQRQFTEQRAQQAQANLEAGQAFLAANAGKPDVVVLPSGLQYRALASGDGEQPTAQDRVRVHYHGTRIDGSVFDSSVERGEPADFPLSGVVPGFREAISNMRVGDHWQVFLPSALAYGERGAGSDIGPNEALIFEIRLLQVLR
ncbi:MAG: FKBP-type peptidyl-prolyl cis-trans isomerase [Gammaproteobacteria bacterium]|nr:FKBP-type peptidyl-prolyl cis-trans isomerase [Gammaproteobacteria bacterium]